MTSSRTRKSTAGSATTEKGSTGKKCTSSKRSTSSKKSGGTRKAAGSRKAPSKKSAAASAPKAEAKPRTSARDIAVGAAGQLLELTGKQSEGVTGLERTEDGWTVHVEVVELRRIPDTTDVLALYELNVDDRGSLEGYRRVRRYVRGVPGEN